MDNDKILIFASKRSNGSYEAEEIVDDLDKLTGGIEYIDAYEEECQVWEYPSGKIYTIKPDRAVDTDDYYATPYSSKGVIWLPKLELRSTDKNRVIEAYKTLSASEKGD